MIYSVKNSDLKVEISSLGAEAVSVKYLGEEKLWQNQNGLWKGHAPILFPFGGHVETVINGVVYPFTQHGFSRKFDYELKSQKDDEISLILKSSKETKKWYPYDFEFTVKYKLCGNSLSVIYNLYNPSDENIYASFAAHDSFMLNEDVDNFYLKFEKEEDFKLFAHSKDGYLLNEYEGFGLGDTFPISKNFLSDGKTMIFGKINSRKVAVVRRDGKKFYEIEFPDFYNLLVWRPGDAEMICVEPWCNLPDTKENTMQEFKTKLGVCSVSPKNKIEKVRRIFYF